MLPKKNHPRKIAKETTISFIGMGFGDVLRYLFTAILARMVGVEYLGIFSLASSVTKLGEVFSLAGLQSGVMRFVSRLDKNSELKEVRQRVQSGMTMGLLFSLMIMVLQIILSKWLAFDLFKGSDLLRTVIIISAISLPFATVMTIAAFATQGFKLLKYKITIMNIIRPAVMLMCLLLFIGLFSKASVIKYPLLISAIIGTIGGLFFLIKLTGLPFSKLFKGKVDRELLLFSYPLMFVTILGTLMHWMDIMMLGYFTDTTTVGLYHPATRTAGLLRTVLMAFLGIFGPMMSEYHRKGDHKEMSRLYKLVVRWITSVSLPLAIIMILYSKKVMLLFGGDYVSSADALSILTLAAFIQSYVGSSGNTLTMAGFPHVNLINSILVLTLNVVLNYMWIPQFGIMGAAYATLVSMTALAILRFIEVKWIVKIHPFSIKMLKPVIAGSVMAVILYFIKSIVFPLHTILTLLIVVMVGFISYTLCLWIMKFDRDDQEIWSGILMIANRRKNT
ncbi:MAG: flippase [Fidelibacterota bacterium]